MKLLHSCPHALCFIGCENDLKMHLNKKDLKYISKTCSQKYQKFLMLFWPKLLFSIPLPFFFG